MRRPVQDSDLAFGDRFLVLGPAGVGGMSTVFRARDRLTGADIALKRLELTAGPERFHQEAALLLELDHPAVVRYVDHGTTPAGQRYLVTEWLDGETLEDRLARGRLSLLETLRLGRRVADGLAVAHRKGIVHRDVKPANLFLPAGDLGQVKLIDFGIARKDTRRLTSTGAALGTPAYMSPEQVRGDRQLDGRADVFSLGCVLFQCLTGEPPFGGDDPLAVMAEIFLGPDLDVAERRPDLPLAVAGLLTRMLSKTAAQRPTAPALSAEIVALLGVLARQGITTGEHALASVPHLTVEQRVTSAIIVTTHPGPPAHPVQVGTWDLAPTSCSPPAFDAGTLEAIRATVAPFSAHAELFLEVAVAVTVSGEGTPADVAGRAARAALLLRGQLPRVCLALGTGRVVGDTLGDLVLATARLPAEPGAIVVDEATATLIENRFQLASWRLLFEKGLREAPRTVMGRDTPCLGRERELARLLGLWESVREDGVARAMLVTGPPGAGKSRLRHEFVERLTASGPLECLIARGDSMRALAPFTLLGSALRAAAGLVGGEPLVVQRKRLQGHVARLLPARHALTVAAFLGELADVPFPDEELPVLRAARRDPRALADQTLAAWLDYVEARCRDYPLLLVIEDLDWGDLPSVAFVDAALRTAAQRPLMVLALARPHVDERFPGLWQERELQRLPLGPLPARAAQRLVEHILTGVPAERAARLVDRADGNPFYLEELARALGGGALAEQLPETVLGMVQARLDALGPDAKRVLRAAAVFGQSFRAEGVRALIADEDHSLDRWLDILVGKEIVFPRRSADGRELVFRHALLAEAAYAMLAPDDRTLAHRLAALHLESAGEREAIVLVEHFEKGGEPLRAAELCLAAAEQALDANDLGAAVERARRGLRLGASDAMAGALRLTEARAHFWRGEYREAEQASELAVTLLDGSARMRATAELVVALGQQAKFAEVAGCLEQVLAGPGDSARLDCLVRGAGYLLAGGTYATAQRLLREVERHEAELEPATRARLDMVRGIVAWQDGRQADALPKFQAAAAAYQALGDLRSATEMLTNLAGVLGDLGLLDEALARTAAVLATAERMQLGFLSPILLINTCLMQAELGHFPEARAAGARAIALARKQGDPRAEGMTELYLSQGAYLEGRLAAAEEHARAAISLLAAITPTLPAAQAALAQALLYQGKAEDALEEAGRAYRTLEARGRVDEGEALIRLVYAECLLESGQASAGEEIIDEASRRLITRARNIENPSWRMAFLSQSTSHARTVALARRLSRA